jgi:hypothetical protein
VLISADDSLFSGGFQLILPNDTYKVPGMQSDNVDAFGQALSGAAWSEWVLDVMSKPREYKGVTKMRINVRNARPVDWVFDSQRLIASLTGQHVA